MPRRPRVSYIISATDATAQGINSAERRLGGLRQQFGSLAGVGRAGAIGLAVVGAEMVRLGEGAINTRNRVRSATDSFAEQELVLRTLRAQSSETGQAIETSLDAFTGINQVQEDIGLTTANMLTLTEVIQKSGAIGGRSTEDISNGIRGLTQALAQGTVRAEEYNQILDNTPDIIRRIVANLDGIESGGQLRQLVLDGEFASETLAISLLGATEDVRAEFDELDRSAGRAFDGLIEAYKGAIDESEALVSINKTLASVLDGFKDVVFGPSDIESRREALQEEIAEVENLIRVNREAIRSGEGTNALQRFLGTTAIENIREHTLELSFLQAKLEGIQQVAEEGTDVSGIIDTAELNDVFAAAGELSEALGDAQTEITEQEDREAGNRARIAERLAARNRQIAQREAAQRQRDIADRVTDNANMFADLRQNALQNSGQLVQIELDRESQIQEAITAAQDQAQQDGTLQAQAGAFAQARIDAELAANEAIKSAREAEAANIDAEAEEAHQKLLERRFVEFEELLAQELGFGDRRNQEKKQQERDLQLGLFAERTRGNDIAQRAAQITADFAVRVERNKVSAITGLVTDLSGVLANHSKTAFNINKVAGIANAVVNTAVGITEALKAPWPLNLVAAASVAAVGAAQIASIKSSTFGGGGGGSSGSIGSGAGGGVAPNVPELPEIPTITAEDRNTTTLRLVVDAESGGLSQAIGESIRTEVDEGGLLVIGPNSPQAEAIRSGSTI